MKGTNHMKTKAPTKHIAKRPPPGNPPRKTKQKPVVPNWSAGEG